ncbi:MAG TPA: hypothetical protein VFZ19_03580, partial [Solirubrobacterales bacterium]
MGRGSIVTAPDGERWRVRRRWLDRQLPSLRQRFRKKRESEPGTEPPIDLPLGLDLLDGTLIGIAVVLTVIVVVFLFMFVLVPLVGIAIELIVLAFLFGSSLVGRFVFRRPWTIEAVKADRPGERVAFAVKG